MFPGPVLMELVSWLEVMLFHEMGGLLPWQEAQLEAYS